MHIQIKRGDPSRLAEYHAVFLDSPLYSHYFTEEGKLDGWLSTAMEKGNLWAALTSRDEAVGCMVIEWDGFFGAFPYLALLGVKKQFRGGGIGHLLLETYIGVARALGCRKCGLLVSSFNPRAKALYQSLGFQKVGYITDFLPGAHENIMVKNL